MNLSTQSLENHLQNQVENKNLFFNFFWHVTRSQFVLDVLKKYQKTRSVVDIGAGAGVFFKHYLDTFPQSRYFFIEPIPVLHDRLAAQPGCEALIGEQAPLPQDAIILLDVLEHISDDLGFAKNLYNRMNSDSLVVITCPAFRFLWSEWDVKMGHCRRYTQRNFQNLLKAAGFEVLESRYLFHLFLFPALWRKFFPQGNSEFPTLSPTLNSILTMWARFELRWFSKIPFGTSVVLVARKN